MMKPEAVNQYGLTNKQERTAQIQARQPVEMFPAEAVKDAADALRVPHSVAWRWQSDPAYKARVEALGGRVHEKPEPWEVKARAADVERYRRREERRKRDKAIEAAMKGDPDALVPLR